MEFRRVLFRSENQISNDIISSVKSDMVSFLERWTSHSRNLFASFKIEHQRFLIIALDEEEQGASGCSIDKLLHFVQDLENRYKITLLNRRLVSYQGSDGSISTLNIDAFLQLISENKNQVQCIFDVLVKSKGEWQNNAKKRVEDSWLAKFT